MSDAMVPSTLGLAAAILLGCALAVVMRERERRLHAPGQLSALLHVPELARADTTLCGPAGMLVVTSPNARDGKTAAAAALGIALAQLRRKVLLIDANLRHPGLHRVLDVPNSWGLTDLLGERTPLSRYPLEGLARPTGVAGLYLLPSGPAAVDAVDLLSAPRMQELLARLRKEFDHILIDAPPALPAPDAAVLGRLSDGALLVARAASTRREAALAAHQRLLADGVRVAGAILTDPRPWDLH